MKASSPAVIVRRAWKPLALVAALGAVMAWSTGAFRDRPKPGRAGDEPGIPLPPDSRVVTAAREPVAARVEIVGTTSSGRRIQLSARLNAFVESVSASAGDRVTAGQVLMTLDDREIREQLAEADAQLKEAEISFKRQSQLMESGATSEQEYTLAQAAFDTARAQHERVKVLLTYASVTSPIDGVVTERFVEAGDLAVPGQVLVSVYDPSVMRLEAPVPVRLIHKFGLQQEVDVTLDYPARRLRGRVTEIVSEVDPQSRTRRVKILLEDESETILPGAFGRVAAEEDPRDAVLVPLEAVSRSGQLEFVHLVDGARALKRLVRTGPRHGDRVEILSGLKEGDRVALAP